MFEYKGYQYTLEEIQAAAEKAGVDGQEELALFIRSFQKDDFKIQETLS